MSEFETVPLPLRGTGTAKQMARTRLLEHLIEVAPMGQAVRLSVEKNGQPQTLRQSLHNMAKRRGYAFHAETPKNDGFYLVWVTPIPANGQP